MRAKLGFGLFACALGLVGCKGKVLEGKETPIWPGALPASQQKPGEVVAPLGAVRRLSQAEFDNTLLDILGDSSRPAFRLLSEDEYAPYDNDYKTQVASETLINGLEVLANEVSAHLLADQSRRDSLVGCSPTADDDVDCFKSFIEAFGRLAFRRPLAADEVTAYMGLQGFATEANPHVDNDFYTAVALVVQSMLQDPEFIYRIERGDLSKGVSGLELASRMSYLLWGSAPDDLLLQAAEKGELNSSEGRKSQAKRMLLDSRAKNQLNRFHSMWLGYRAIPHAARLVQAFDKETRHLIDWVVFDQQRNYLELFRSDQTYVDDFLADHYGLDRPEGGEGWVKYKDKGRAGILSHGSVLASFSKFTDTSPTQRGIFVRTRLMCDKIQDPPPNVDVDQPPASDDPNACKVDRYKAHMDVVGCKGCHSQMDPIGFGLERFDMAGKYREHDDDNANCQIAGQGNLPAGGTFSGPAQLAQQLIEAQRIDACFVKQYFSFTFGYEATAADQPLIDQLTQQFRAGEHKLQDFIVNYVSSPEFAQRRGE